MIPSHARFFAMWSMMLITFTADAAELLNVTPKRGLEFIAPERIEAVYLNGYYIPETELKKLRQRQQS